MLDWQDNNMKMMSKSNFKIKASKRALDIVKKFLFEFGVI